LPFPFTLTARAENFIAGRPDLDDTIRRLQAFQEAGADVLYAPGLSTREQIQSVLAAVDRPLNVLVGLPGMSLDLADFAQLGVRRLSVGGGLARVAYGALVREAQQMLEQGTFTIGEGAPSGREIVRHLG
jgi:2-methylisocitrate lyase-like PEP mutase family enzyme